MTRFLGIVPLQLFFCLTIGVQSVLGIQEEEPIKATQSDTVPVTEELLEREGDVGPASPTIKMEDTSQFLVKKPYERAEEEVESVPGDESRPWWKSWFFWLGEEEKAPESETR